MKLQVGYFICSVLLVLLSSALIHGAEAETILPTTWYLAEGCTSGSFEEYILVQNPSSELAECRVTLMKSDGTTVDGGFCVPATSRHTISVNDIVPDDSVSAKVESLNGVGIIVERAMYWDSFATDESAPDGYSAGINWVDGTASVGITSLSDTWYFAEGCTNGFDEWILVQNPNEEAVNCTATFMKNDGSTVVREFTVPATCRYTIKVNDVIRDQDVSVKIESEGGLGILAERSMYWNKNWLGWVGGHSSVGITAPDTTWYFAEGCTNGFDEWILIQNPNDEVAECKVTFMEPDGATTERTCVIKGTSRHTIGVNEILPDKSVSVKIESTNEIGIIAERAMYWDPGGNAPEGTYIACGDSITYGYGATYDYGYAPRLESMLDDYADATVFNEGVPGELTSEGWGRMERTLKDRRSEYVLLMEGTNDVSCSVPTEYIISNLRNMIKLAQMYGTKAVLANILPRQDERNEHVVYDVNPSIQNLAGELNVPFVDVYSPIAQDMDRYMHDYLHPNDEGFDLMTWEWFNTIHDLDDSQYYSLSRFAGHCSGGITSPAKTWYLAEGCTNGFDEWVSIQNPSSNIAYCTVTFMKPDGTTIERNITVGATSRYSLNVNNIVLDSSVSIKIQSTNDVGIVVERSMYWDAGNLLWGGGHCSAGFASE